jgi:hypothetical protein
VAGAAGYGGGMSTTSTMDMRYLAHHSFGFSLQLGRSWWLVQPVRGPLDDQHYALQVKSTTCVYDVLYDIQLTTLPGPLCGWDDNGDWRDQIGGGGSVWGRGGAFRSCSR